MVIVRTANRLIPGPLAGLVSLQLLLPCALARPLAADNVHLANGKVYENVVAEIEGDVVRVHLSFGTISLAGSQVARVDLSETALERYLHRRESLEADLEVSPEQWLELARWARRAGLPYGSREAALMAAELDPELEGVAAILKPFGYRQDPETRQWQPRTRERAAGQSPRKSSSDWQLEELAERIVREQRRQEEQERCCQAPPPAVEVKVVTTPQPTYLRPALYYPWTGGVVMGTGGWDRLKTRVPGSPLPISKD